MTVRRFHAVPFFLLTGLLLGTATVRAQETSMETEAFTNEENAAPERKRPSWWIRPEKNTPAEQLVWADTLRDKGNLRSAKRQYSAIVHTWHDSPEAPVAQLRYAQVLESLGAYPTAFREYQYLIDNFSGHFDFQDTVDRQFRIANRIRTTRRGRFFFFRGFLSPEQALPLFQTIVKNSPHGEHGERAQFAVGEIFEEMGETENAINAYEALSLKQPPDSLTEAAAFRRAVCLHQLVRSRPRSEPGYREALSALSIFLSDYPRSQHVDEAKTLLEGLKEQLATLYFERALYYDLKARRPEAAIIAYTDFVRNFPASERATVANERIVSLKLKLEGNHENP